MPTVPSLSRTIILATPDPQVTDSYKWPPKSPGTTQDYSFDVTAWASQGGESVLGFSVYVAVPGSNTSPLDAVAQSVVPGSDVCTAIFSGGVSPTNCAVTFLVSTATRTLQITGWIVVSTLSGTTDRYGAHAVIASALDPGTAAQIQAAVNQTVAEAARAEAAENLLSVGQASVTESVTTLSASLDSINGSLAALATQFTDFEQTFENQLLSIGTGSGQGLSPAEIGVTIAPLVDGVLPHNNLPELTAADVSGLQPPATSAFGTLPGTVADGGLTLAKVGDTAATSLSYTEAGALQAFHTDWYGRLLGAARYIDSYENSPAFGTTAMFLDADSLADARRLGRIGSTAGVVSTLAVINAAVASTTALSVPLVWTRREYVPGGQILLPDPAPGVPSRVMWFFERGAYITHDFDIAHTPNGVVQNTTAHSPTVLLPSPIFINDKIRSYMTFAVDAFTGLPVADEQARYATCGGDCRGLTHPTNGQPISLSNWLAWQTSATQVAPAGTMVLYFDAAPPIPAASPIWTNAVAPVGVHLLRWVAQGTTVAGAPYQVTNIPATSGVGTWSGWALPLAAPNTRAGYATVTNTGIGQANTIVRDLPGATPYQPPVYASSANPAIGEQLAIPAPSVLFFRGNNSKNQGPTPRFYLGSHRAIASDGGLWIEPVSVGCSGGQAFNSGGDNNTFHRMAAYAPDVRESNGVQMWIFAQKGGNRMYDTIGHSGDDALQIVNGDVLKNGVFTPGSNHDVVDTKWIRGFALSYDGRAAVVGLVVGASNFGFTVGLSANGMAPTMPPNSNALYFDEGTFTSSEVAQMQASAAAATAGTLNSPALIYAYKKFYVRSGNAYVSGYADAQTIGAWTGIVVTLTEPSTPYAIAGNRSPIPPGQRVTFVIGFAAVDFNCSVRECGVSQMTLMSANNNCLTIANSSSLGEADFSVDDVCLDCSLAAPRPSGGEAVDIVGGPYGGVRVKLRRLRVIGHTKWAVTATGYIQDLDIQDCFFGPPRLNTGVANLLIAGVQQGIMARNRFWPVPGGMTLQLGQSVDSQDNFGNLIPQAANDMVVTDNFFMGCQDGQVALQVNRLTAVRIAGNTYQQATQPGFGSAAAIWYDTSSSCVTIDNENMLGLDAPAPILAQGNVTAAAATIGYGMQQNPAPNGAFAPIARVQPASSPTVPAYVPRTAWSAVPTITFTTPGGALVVVYTSASGNYERIGNIVYVDFSVSFSLTFDGTTAGYLQIQGLPFQAATGTNFPLSLASPISGIAYPNADSIIEPIINGGASAIQMVGFKSTGGTSTESIGQFTTGGTYSISGAGSYVIAPGQ